MEDNKNSYTIESSSIGHNGGRYISKSPLGAARKMATQLFKLIKTESTYKKFSGKTITISVRKTTSGNQSITLNDKRCLPSIISFKTFLYFFEYCKYIDRIIIFNSVSLCFPIIYYYKNGNI